DDTTCDSFQFHSDVWYTFVAADTDASIETTITGASDQANVAVYSSIDCSQLDVDSIACSDGNGGESIDLTGLTPAATYYVRVWSDGVVPATRAEGTFDIVVNNALLGTESFDVNGFEYFPNPVNDNLTLRSLSNIQNVAVYNMLGQEVMKLTPNTVNAEVDMRSLSQGSYFVKVTINDATDTIRIIKK
ncbi:MAG: T9SS type A sorting domain-containing protein, partial [Flavobacteriaceae bacterium]|nr:T9SS type A sorting domain-containing protein [Flavobacteriaceae bacterium]